MTNQRSAARVHPPVVPDPEMGCDACGEPMTNYDADGQWCDKHGKQSAVTALPLVQLEDRLVRTNDDPDTQGPGQTL